jgi:predicted nucleic acid-binding protein
VVTGLVDTTILVDVIRRHQPAAAWLSAQPPLGITPMVYMELMSGARDKTEQLKSARLLARFQMVYPTQADMDWAMEQQMAHALSHGVGVLDCLIASVNHRLQLPLYTGNLKHFARLLGDLARKPY